MLGQLEQSALYNAVNFSVNIDLPENMTIQRSQVNGLLCPSDSAAWRDRHADHVGDLSRLAGGPHQL